MKKIIPIIFVISLVGAGCSNGNVQSNTTPETPTSNNANTTTLPAVVAKPLLNEPISGALSRINKKPFGIFITPKTSPVQPEKFSGYHTGTDFEVSDDEQNKDLQILAACDGKLLLKKYATGYGGVAVQSCVINDQDVTVIYGHLKVESITKKINESVKAGEVLGILGKGYSTETDGERKHLHFGIHKGTSINILGYVQNQAQIKDWLDASLYLK